jgi:hypothetical protein
MDSRHRLKNTIISLFSVFCILLAIVIFSNNNEKKENKENYTITTMYGDMFMYRDRPDSIYRIPVNKRVFCEDGWEYEEKLFCLYYFDYSEPPLGGWIELFNMQRIEK